MKNSKYMASCPVCGHGLFRGQPGSYLEGGCPKCREYLKIAFTEDGFTVSRACNEARQSAMRPNKTE